jgi:LysR family glycine cleavage system transcriptional activator
MQNLPNLTWLRTFEAAARLLNFTETGKELGLTQTAVSQHMKSLETSLGCRLFVRKPRGLELTALGLAYLPAVRQALADISLTTGSLFGLQARQTLTVKLPMSTAALWLAPKLPEFIGKHPNVNVRMVSNIWADSTWGEDADLEIRLGRGDWPGVTSVRLSDETIVPVAAARDRKAGPGIADLPRGDLIHILGYEDSWQRYFVAHGLDDPKGDTRVSVDTTVAALELVAADGGFACVLTRFAESAIGAGHPIRIVGDPVPFPQSHYLVRANGGRPPHPAALLFEGWLRDGFRR